MNRYPFNQCCYLYLARGLMAFGVILISISSKIAMADVLSLDVNTDADLVDNTAVVTGTVACSAGEMYNVGAVVVQDQGVLENAMGTGSLVPPGDLLPCSGSDEPFEIPVSVVIPPDGTFEPGPAKARVSAHTRSPTGSNDTESVDTTLNLSR
jgi:hypothetical protein